MGIEEKPVWMFVIDLDDYAGNDERSMCEYLTGRSDIEDNLRDPDPESGDYYYLYSFKEEVPENSFRDLFGLGIDDPGDDGVRRSPVTLVPTPGLENLGDGTVVPLKPGKEPKYAAYNSIGLFLRRKPTEAELTLLTDRAYQYATLPPLHEWDIRPTIKSCRLVLLKTTLDTQWSSKN
jgi:hypothetical protein